jgi:predicted nuclease of predicted toxin-antitoxin system
MAILTDEHVPRVVITTLRSNGHEVVKANTVFGEATNDAQLLRYCREHEHVLLTHDRDFAGDLSETIEHAGIVVYSDVNFLRDCPEDAVRALERVFRYYPPEELHDEVVWLDQWQ